MKRIMGHITGKLSLSILVMFVLLIGVLAAMARADERQHLFPPASVTGDVNPEITQENVLTTVCVAGYTKSERSGKTAAAGPAPTAKMKAAVYGRDGMKPATARVNGKKVVTCCEVDHLISLELGGKNSLANLWAEPYKEWYLPNADALGAREKDQVEDYLHRAICKQPGDPGWMSLADAQKAIAGNWVNLYVQFVKK